MPQRQLSDFLPLALHKTVGRNSCLFPVLYYKQALKLETNNAAIQMGLGMAYNCIGKSTEALKLLQSLLATVQTSSTKEQAQLDPATLAEILA